MQLRDARLTLVPHYAANRMTYVCFIDTTWVRKHFYIQMGFENRNNQVTMFKNDSTSSK